ncbi:hypothetical protein ESCOMA049B1_13380 [Escherichia coli]
MNTSSWNKGRIVGQKRPLQISHIWGIRIRLELEGKTRDLAETVCLFLAGCDVNAPSGIAKLKITRLLSPRYHAAQRCG